MIIVRTTLNVFPEKQLEVIQTLLSLIEPVGGEPGCNSCCAFCDIKDKHRLILLEEWETQKDLDQHIQSLRFGVLLGTRTLLCEPPQIQIHTVSRTRGMETVHAIRQNQEES
jgi:quinol monooxygenase YgiN